MSTNHTPNYALSLWEASDQVVRTEFNENHAKIDAALNGIGRIQILAQQDSSPYTFNLEGFDWTRWALIGVTMHVPYNTNTSSFMACVVDSVSGRTQAFCSGDGNNFAHMGNTSSVCILTPFHDPEREVHCVYLGKESGAGFASCKFSEVKQLVLGGGGSFPIGCYATLWGVK